MQLPDVRYARSGDLAIAFQVVGDGRPDVVFVRGIAGDLVSTWDQPLLVRHVEGLAACGRLIMIDRRGTGLSDRVREVHSAETAMDDVRAVIDFVGLRERRALGRRYRDRCRSALCCDVSRTLRGAYSLRPTCEGNARHRLRGRSMRTDGAISLRRCGAAGATEAFSRNWRTNGRRRSPTTRLSESGLCGTCVAASVPGPRSLRIAQPWRLTSATSSQQFGYRRSFCHDLRNRGLRTIWPNESRGPRSSTCPRFVASTRGLTTLLTGRRWMRRTGLFPASARRAGRGANSCSTLLFTDIVGSTEPRLPVWATRAGVTYFSVITLPYGESSPDSRGGNSTAAGDGFFASFDGPARAVRAATAIGESLQALEIEVRAGVHTGECELSDGKVVGVAVSIASRIASLAGPGEVLTSSTVKDLVAGSGLQFDDRGEHELKGINEPWRIFAVR